MTTAAEDTAPTGPPGGEELPLLRLRGVSKHFGPVQAPRRNSEHPVAGVTFCTDLDHPQSWAVADLRVYG
jgi:hypothetical protein